jgi:hypothetical protein
MINLLHMGCRVLPGTLKAMSPSLRVPSLNFQFLAVLANHDAGLTIRGKRRSLPSALSTGVVADLALCLEAPRT